MSSSFSISSGSISATKISPGSIGGGRVQGKPPIRGGEGEMSDSTFFGKMIINALANWSGCYGDDTVIRAVMERLSDDFGGSWRDLVDQRVEEYQQKEIQKHGKESTYVLYDKALSKNDIDQIIEGIIAHVPSLAHPFRISKSSEIIGDLLDLSDTEKLMMDCAARFHSGGDYDFNFVLSKVHRIERFENKPDEMFAVLFGVDVDDVREALDGFLFRAGICIPENRAPKAFFSINADMAAAFTHRDLTYDNIDKLLFPSMIETNLTVQDYSYIEKEIGYCANSIKKGLDDRSTAVNIMLWGEPGTGKTELAFAMAKTYGWNLKVIGDISVDDTQEKSRHNRIASLKLATKLFKRDPSVVLLFDEMEDLFNKQDNNAAFSKAFINRIIETTQVPIIWTTNSLGIIGNAGLRRMTYNIGVENPPAEARARIWGKYAKEYGLDLDEATLKAFGETFDVAPALIRNASMVAGGALDVDGRADREAICEIVTALDRLVNYGYKRNFKLPSEKDEEESTYDASCSNTDRDLGEFTEKLLKAKPHFSLLLYGVSGSGKSQFGQELAKRMGKKVLLKRGSDLLGMYVGETEKNIARAFYEAKEKEMLLLIDEGDTFLRNRDTAVRSWEVSMVNEMLTQMETFDQPFVMTTNLKDDLDTASMRRFTFKLRFDYMRADQVEKLFRGYFNAEAPAALLRETMLSPGDFANVQRQVDILNITDVDEITALLIEEVKTKPNARRPVGF